MPSRPIPRGRATLKLVDAARALVAVASLIPHKQATLKPDHPEGDGVGQAVSSRVGGLR